MPEDLHDLRERVRKFHDSVAGKVLCVLTCLAALAAMLFYAKEGGLQSVSWFYDQVQAENWAAAILLLIIVFALCWASFLVIIRNLYGLVVVLVYYGLLLVFYAPALAILPRVPMPNAPIGIHVLTFMALAAISWVLLWPLTRQVNRLLER